jgi:hypothetical protein
VNSIPPGPEHREIFKRKVMKSEGSHRLSVAQLEQWEALELGMFIHFGMSTFDGGDQSIPLSPHARHTEIFHIQGERVTKH